MKRLTLLLFGPNLPPPRHLHKLSNKFIKIFLKEREKETFRECDYYQVEVEVEYFGDKQREYAFSPVIPVHRDFLHQVEKIYGNLNAEMMLCTMQHEHHLVRIADNEYEGYCYYSKFTNEKILFFDFDLERVKKTCIKMPKEEDAEKVMEEWLSGTKINK
ncbi:hypothetical protein ACQCT6_12765 [Cytobacillus gottheilii]|uniref:hypothetical protein n=1 Tax=Cytobacillus gottheilii TaxID=859144 RepID=UPI003CE91056